MSLRSTVANPWHFWMKRNVPWSSGWRSTRSSLEEEFATVVASGDPGCGMRSFSKCWIHIWLVVDLPL